MYNNSGVKTKNIASVWMVVDSIITVLLAAVFYSAVSADCGGAAFLIAIIILGIGLAIAWLSYLLLYGFGELIAETCYTREALENLTEELETSGYAKKTTNKHSQTNTSQNNTTWKNIQKTDKKVCPYCGKPLTDNYCADCLAYFGE